MTAEEINTDTIYEAFKSGDVYKKTDEELKQYLMILSSSPVTNPAIHHAFVIRAQTINQLLYQREILKLDQQNTKTQRWFMALAVASLIASVIDIFKC